MALVVGLSGIFSLHASTAHAQRPSLSGLQQQIDYLTATICELFRLTGNIEPDFCGVGEIYQCADGIDNDGDGLTDYHSHAGCWSDIDNDETNIPPFESKIVFYADTGKGANLGGVSGADAICQEHAVAAGLTGTFKAWISDNNFANTPNERFNKW